MYLVRPGQPYLPTSVPWWIGSGFTRGPQGLVGSKHWADRSSWCVAQFDVQRGGRDHLAVSLGQVALASAHGLSAALSPAVGAGGLAQRWGRLRCHDRRSAKSPPAVVALPATNPAGALGQ